MSAGLGVSAHHQALVGVLGVRRRVEVADGCARLLEEVGVAKVAVDAREQHDLARRGAGAHEVATARGDSRESSEEAEVWQGEGWHKARGCRKVRGAAHKGHAHVDI